MLSDEVLIPITSIILIPIVLLIRNQIIDITHRFHLLHVLLLYLAVDEDDDRLLDGADLPDCAVIAHLDLGVALADVFEFVEVGVDAGLFLVAV